MKKPLLDVIFASEKRKNVLLLLQDGPQGMEILLKSLDTTRQSLLPQVRILEEHHLVDHYDDTYELTTIGKLIIDEMKPLLYTIKVFDKDIDYWGNHDLSYIPPHFLQRIDELRECRAIKPSITDLYEIDEEFHEASKRSESHSVITTYIHPEFYRLVYEMMNNNVQMYFVFPPDLLDQLQPARYAELIEVSKSEFVHIFVYPKKVGFLFFAFNDTHSMLSLTTNNGKFDGRYLLCRYKKSLEWEKDLFDYYLKESTPINEI
ncbi:helix-turn-helix transcriptional regulator [Methanolobus halotolerans]|uniref:Transcriptional regulator n=1 Tax=Methanolobus halotolerans TaxID=2052935 RepID=A0A4E0Q693_9EURY|nr:winged helix-turn-helix domain-containing protein [Methanolobus halotolerans]TGC09526.1 transcriptional regulator [Methanolobus halotolerans]